jgi:multidrug efflux pump subunit AcrA (membrane-fusion protein)
VNSPLRVVTHLPQWSVARLKRGSVVKIRYGGRRDPIHVLTGKIDEIARLPDTASYLYHGPPLYTTRIRIDEPPPDLVMDMNVRVEIDLGQFDNVLVVPADSVVLFQRKDHVAVKAASGGFEWREVALGVTDGASIEVTKGVQSGEVVFREPARLLGTLENRRTNVPPARPAATAPAVR